MTSTGAPARSAGPRPGRIAAIDCGTNSIRLLVADPVPAPGPAGPAGAAVGVGPAVGDGHAPLVLAELVRRMEIVRLGQGVDRTGRLAPEALERTRAALASYAAQLAELGVDRIRMVATSATRDAANADEFHAMVVDALGVPPEVVSGEQEARLSFAGAVRGLPAELPGPYLVVDIGGGSTEFVMGGDGPASSTVEHAVSVGLGCVRMTERHLHSDPPSAAEVEAAVADIGAVVDGALATVPGRRAGTLVGLAGSVTTVAALALGLDRYRPEVIHHARLPYDRVAEVTADLLRRSHPERLALPAMHAGRADVISAGALALRVIMERTGLDTVVVSEHDILDGIAYSLLYPGPGAGPIEGTDPGPAPR